MTEWVYEHDGLSIRIAKTGSRAVIQWKGVSDSRNPAGFLNPLIQDWSERLRDVEVTVDLTELDYMNSATVKPLINFIRVLDTSGHQVSVVFREVDWQRTHRNCMLALARTLNNTHVQ